MSHDEIQNNGGMHDDLRAEIEAQVEKEAAAIEKKQKKKKPEKTVELSDEELKRAFYRQERGDAELVSKRWAGKFCYDNQAQHTYKFNCTHWFIDVQREYLHCVFNIADEYSKKAYYHSEESKKLKHEKGNKDVIKDHDDKASKYRYRANQLNEYNRAKRVWQIATSGNSPLSISGKEWNTNETLLPCGNCVIDLETGKTHPGSPTQFFNKASSVEWRGFHSNVELWDDILNKALCYKEDLREYFDYFVGCAATGHQTKDFFCAYGPGGANGKSVIFDWLARVLGDFAGTIKVEYLLEERFMRAAGGPDPATLKLRGLRLAVTSEAQQNHRFSLAKIKALTSGGDLLEARGIHEKTAVEFKQTHTLLLHSNFLPRAEGNDQAFYDRMKVLPFRARFVRHEEEECPEEYRYYAIPRTVLDKELERIQPGILAYVVKCAMKFLRVGDMPPPPACVLEETAEYREEQDIVGQFLRMCCERDPVAREQMKDIHSAFKKWCMEEMGIPEKRVRSLKALAGDFKQRPEIGRIEQNVVYYMGYRINPEWRDSAMPY